MADNHEKEWRASAEHERDFRATWRLRDDLASDQYWVTAYEYAAQYRLTIPEINALGPALVRLEADRG